MVNSNVTTIELTGAEQKIQFALPYPYYWVHNMGDSDVYISMAESVTADADGVITVPAGGAACTMHGHTNDTVYVSGTGKIQIMGAYNAFSPFKSASGGGESGGGSTALKTLYGQATIDGTVTITFDDEFVEPPTVLISFEPTGNIFDSYLYLSYIKSVTTTDFTAHSCYNKSSAVNKHAGMLHWVAFGK